MKKLTIKTTIVNEDGTFEHEYVNIPLSEASFEALKQQFMGNDEMLNISGMSAVYLANNQFVQVLLMDNDTIISDRDYLTSDKTRKGRIDFDERAKTWCKYGSIPENQPE